MIKPETSATTLRVQWNTKRVFSLVDGQGEYKNDQAYSRLEAQDLVKRYKRRTTTRGLLILSGLTVSMLSIGVGVFGLLSSFSYDRNNTPYLVGAGFVGFWAGVGLGAWGLSFNPHPIAPPERQELFTRHSE